MSVALLISSLLLGLASSLHCVGMCGPLVMSIPVQHLPNHKKLDENRYDFSHTKVYSNLL